ncbi:MULTISPECIES: hypothetical protein [Thermodesulfobacterium]|jgi:hypothetical protein|uniref:Uncharacterized protein n=1 Tax=Thermodesulfobacterium commune TaxID=1741 RepID=A0A3B8N5Y9_9BACT|nr:hypothetical protein [Thermodesulfobacterium sp.]HAA83646.1 hypothetical protein [Thermodesulfobacterium commune]MBZ4682403.1 hypothetical protein [Thermodesulfobacterium sp.]MDK2861555.1 hypothetical protein [Thermodesulfobacterium sp.]MDN5380426.1 hypothetical protein [Thermodesulfobacterium sp.]HBT03746.1 hypothetical protein [Thermodesulfobacterium commune]
MEEIPKIAVITETYKHLNTEYLKAFRGFLCFGAEKNFSFLNLPNKFLIFIDKRYKRTYRNFNKIFKTYWGKLLFEYLKAKNLEREYKSIILWSLNYRSLKLYGYNLPKAFSYKDLLKEANLIIQAYYCYYSIACAVLTGLFFGEVGLPQTLPKLEEKLYGQDFLDDFFFPVAFTFTVLESTNDLILKEPPPADPGFIVKAFLSFLLWKGTKALIKIPYGTLIKLGIPPSWIWITL